MIEPGSIVQILPDCETNPMFGACLLVVTEMKSFGVMGYVQSLGENGKRGGQAYIRLKTGEYEDTGGFVSWSPEGAIE